MAAINAFFVRGIRVRIDQSWFIAFFLFAWTLSAGYFPFQVPDYSTFTYWIFGTLSSLALFGCVLVHELSHCVIAQRMGIPVRQITLFIFGGVSEMTDLQTSTPRAEFRTTIAGPLASIGLGAIFFTLAVLARGSADRIVIEMLQYLYYVNFLLAAFNLIPGFPLDGGRVLRSYLWLRSGDLRQATRSAARVGKIFATTLIALGFMSIIGMHIVPGIWLILVGLFLKRSAEAEYESFEVRLGLQDMKISDVMAPPIAVESSTTISQLVNDYVFHHHQRVFPVLENGRFIGMIDVRSIRAVPAEEWPTTKIGSHLSDSSTYSVLDPDLEATVGLRTLVTQNRNSAPIVRNGVLIGMLTRDDLLRLITLKREIAA